MADTYAPVPPPPVDRPLVNLLAAARTPQGENLRWEEGIAYESLACGSVLLRDPCSSTLDGVFVRGDFDDAEGSEASEDRLVRARSVYAEAGYTCSALGWRETYRDRALAALDSELVRAVERELWAGPIGQTYTVPNRALTADATDLTPGTGAVSPELALGLLEEALAGVYSGVGIIHVPRIATSVLNLGGGSLTRTARIIETLAGNRVVPGIGYPNTGPGDDAADEGTAWLYVTPMVTVRLGSPELPSESDLDASFLHRGVNRLEIRPRALFTVDWDGCDSAFAVQLDLT
jgi:hypothetical protein